MTAALNAHWVSAFRKHPEWCIAYANQSLSLRLLKKIQFQLIEDEMAIQQATQRARSSTTVSSKIKSVKKKIDSRTNREVADKLRTGSIS